MVSREKLPFRINCEGYFLNSKGEILAKDSSKGFIMFPGGGIDELENIENAMIRETKEETGFIPKNIKKLGTLKIIWGVDWAKTEKQKARYEKFRGDEMHFFKGTVDENEIYQNNEEDSWFGEKFMQIGDVINIIEKSKPFEQSVKEYRENQLKFLKSLKV